MMNYSKNLLPVCTLLLAVVLIAPSCKEEAPLPPANTKYYFTPGPNNQIEVQEALILMENNDTIEFSAGTFEFTSTLSVEGKTGIVVQGAGRDNTILSFANQTAGAQGILGVNLNWFLMRNLTIQDPIGDGIKIQDSDGISLMGVGTVYTGPVSEDNGAYGIYPVTSKNVFIDGCYVRGASDAGVYVGQTEQVVVRNSTVEENVAGIEIENCINSDVYGNTARNNTGGILVFDLENLPIIPNGNTCRVYENTVTENNHANFAAPGTSVANVPVGTGIMVLSFDGVEIFDNTISDNNVMSIGLISMLTLKIIEGDANPVFEDPYDPYIYNINIHNNTISRQMEYPAETNAAAEVIIGEFPDGDVPEIVYDGFIAPSLDGDDTEGICITNNGSAGFVDMNVPGIFFNKRFDLTPHDCSPASLTKVSMSAPGYTE